MVPVAHLVFHFGLVRLAAADPDRPAVPIGPHQRDLAQRSLLDPLDLAEVFLAVPALEADDHLQAFLVGLLVGLHHGAETGGVDAHRLLHEDVFAGRNGRGIMDRAKARRRGQQHDVRAGRQRLLVGVETGEHAVLRHVDLGGVLRLLAQIGQASLGVVGEGVGHGNQLDVFAAVEAVAHGARAAAAAADQGKLQLVAARGVGGTRKAQSAGQGKPCRGGRAVLQKISARWLRCVTHRGTPWGRNEGWTMSTGVEHL